MAINTIHATIQVRYGAEEDLDPDQLTTGEWAAATDTKKVWMCFRPGLVLRMATYEGFEQDMKEIQDMLVECRDIQTAVERFMQLAVQHKNDAAEYSALSESYSHQAKEEADRAREEADRAAAIAGFNVDSALSETSVDPVQNRVITKELSNKLDKTGDASEVTVTFEKAKTRTNIFSKDSLRTIIGKIQKWFDDLPSTRIIGVINILTDINQINDAYRNWRIASIDSEYAGEIGLDKNTGDFYATLLSYNGDGINFNYGNIILSSPRLGNDFYLLQIWSGVVHATYSRADVPIVTNNDLATIPGTAWDAVRGAQIRKDLDKLNSDLYTFESANLLKGVCDATNESLTNFGKCYKCGNFVIVKAYFASMYFTSNATMFVVPEGFRPKSMVEGIIHCQRLTGGQEVNTNICIVSASGNISQQFNNDGTSTIWHGDFFALYKL